MFNCNISNNVVIYKIKIIQEGVQMHKKNNSNTIVPKEYKSKLDIYQTQTAIGYIKNRFQYYLDKLLNLKRVSAPLFVLEKSGLNDWLDGDEPVSFKIPYLNEKAEIVHSLAKWKRKALHDFDFHEGNGLYTDMNAIRKEEILSNLHSLYVDQWDWEKVITAEQRTLDYLMGVVETITMAIYKTSLDVKKKYKKINYVAPKSIFLISSQELLNTYPDLSLEEREYEITKKHEAVFIYQIGWPLSNGEPHDKRAADYDDWDLNGDIIYYHKTLDCAMELSSMGIRVNKDSLYAQLKHRNRLDDLKYPYHQQVYKDELPLTIGGGIGQSRLCMLLLEKAHIGEVQSSIWDEKTVKLCQDKINLI